MTATEVQVFDIESALVAIFRADATIQAEIAERVYAVFPAKVVLPALRVTRIGGAPQQNRPLVLDRAIIQLDAFAEPNQQGGKAIASRTIDGARDALTAAYGKDAGGGLVIGAAQWVSLAYDPDASYTPAAPRYRADVLVTYRRPTAI